jgi:hypothetical protein
MHLADLRWTPSPPHGGLEWLILVFPSWNEIFPCIHWEVSSLILGGDPRPYLQIPMFPPHRKYLRFCVQGVHYQFRAMPFGITVAPRVFTKLMVAVGGHLRSQQIHIFMYLDDWLVKNQIRELLLWDFSMYTLRGFKFNIGWRPPSFFWNNEKGAVKTLAFLTWWY